MAREGGKLILTYQGDRFKESVVQLAAEIPGSTTLSCDVSNEEEIIKLFAKIKADFGGLDCMAHCIAHARKEELAGPFIETVQSCGRN